MRLRTRLARAGQPAATQRCPTTLLLIATGASDGNTAGRPWLAVTPGLKIQRPFATRNKRRSAPRPNKTALTVFRDRAARSAGVPRLAVALAVR